MITGLIGAGVGALGGVLGGISKNNALSKQIERIEAQKGENQAWFDRRYNEDATQRADAQRLLTMTEQAIKNRNRAAAGTAAVMGGTEESVAAARAANAQAYSDTASQIAASAADRKDKIESQYIARKDELQGQINELEAQKKSGLDIASDAIGGAMKGFGAGMGLG